MEPFAPQIWDRSLAESWAVLGRTGGVIFQILVFGLTAIVTWKMQGGGEGKKVVVSGLIGAAVIVAAWLLVLLLHFAILTPRSLLKEQDNMMAAQQNASPTPIKFDTADYQLRDRFDEVSSDLRNTQLQLKNTDSTLQTTQTKLDDARKVIARYEEERRPRVITKEQEKEAVDYLKGIIAPRIMGAEVAKPRVVLCNIEDNEAYNFALRIRSILVECGFDVPELSYKDKHGLMLNQTEGTLGKVQSQPAGLLISVSNEENQSRWAVIIQKALTKLNGGEVPYSRMEKELAERFSETDVIVVVGKKPIPSPSPS